MSSIVEERIKLDCDFDSKIYDTLRILTANETKVDIYANVVRTIAEFNNRTFLDVQLDISSLESELLNIIGNEEEDERDSLILKMDYVVLKFLERALNVYGIRTYPVNELLGIDLICNTLATMNIIYTLEEGMESIVKDYCETMEDDPDAFCGMLENLGDKWKEDYLTVVESVDPELKITLGKWLQDKEAGTSSVTEDDIDLVNFVMRFELSWIHTVVGNDKIRITDFLSYASERDMYNKPIEENIGLAESFLNYAYKKMTKDILGIPSFRLTNTPSILALTLLMSTLTESEPTCEIMFRQGTASRVFDYLVNTLHVFDFSNNDTDESYEEKVKSVKQTIAYVLLSLRLVRSEEEVKYDGIRFNN